MVPSGGSIRSIAGSEQTMTRAEMIRLNMGRGGDGGPLRLEVGTN